MAFKKRFKLSDETVNCYGFWVSTTGIDLTQAQKNLPAFYDHKTWEIPVGHWENLSVNAQGELWGDLVIDGANDREKEFIRKIENGDLKGASCGFDPLAWNEEPTQLKQGQTVPTLEKCDLFEASITPLPGNKNALALKTKEGFITLSENTLNIIPTLKNHEPDMKAIALKLGLPENATEQDILNKIASIQLSANNADTYHKQYLDTATEGMDEETKETFVELSKTNEPLAAKFLSKHKKDVAEQVTEGAEGAKTPVKKETKIVDLIKKAQGANLSAAADAEGKDTYDYLQKHNKVELARLHKEEPARYAELAADYSNGKRYTGK